MVALRYYFALFVRAFVPFVPAGVLLGLHQVLPEFLSWLRPPVASTSVLLYCVAWVVADVCLTGRRASVPRLLDFRPTAELLRFIGDWLNSPQSGVRRPSQGPAPPFPSLVQLLATSGPIVLFGLFGNALTEGRAGQFILLHLCGFSVVCLLRGVPGTFEKTIWADIVRREDEVKARQGACRKQRQEVELCYSEHLQLIVQRLPRSEIELYFATYINEKRTADEVIDAGEQMCRRIEKIAGEERARLAERRQAIDEADRARQIQRNIEQLDGQIRALEEEILKDKAAGGNPHLLEREYAARRKRREALNEELRKTATTAA